MLKQHSISVIIPTHNRGYCLPRALHSIDKQTRLPDQVIVVNDGSTDNTAAIIQRLKANAPYPVVYIEIPKSGVAKARNLALDACNTDLIAFLDSDDSFKPRHLELLATPFSYDSELPLSFCLSNLSKIDLLNIIAQLPSETLPSNNTYILNNAIELLIPGGLFVPSEVMVSAKLAKSIGKFNQKYTHCSDWDFFLRLLIGNKAGFVNQQLTFRIMGTDSLGKQKKGLTTEKFHLEVCYEKINDKSFFESLSREQQQKIDSMIEKSLYDYRYGLSEFGIVNYLKSLSDLKRYKNLNYALHPRALVRACLHSLGLRPKPQ